MNNRHRPNRFVRAGRKLLLSAFLILSFGAYALEHGKTGEFAPGPTPVTLAALQSPAGTGGSTPTEAPAATAEATTAPTQAPAETATQSPASTATSSAPAAPTTAPTAAPTATTAPAPTASSGLKDGTYTGPSVDVQWGLVQVQATIQGGKIADVQFLQYPSDRRTSQRINSQADPWLQQEAIQAQSANVDIIGGATLTSEGFAESLQAALDQAHS